MTVIAISGLPGAGSSATAKALAARLNLHFFSAGQLFKDISTGKVKERNYYPLLKELCDKENLVIPEFNYANDSLGTISLWDTEFGKSHKLHHLIDSLQKELGKKGNIVAEGKLAITMVENANFRIWLKASLDARAKRSAHRDSLDIDSAKEILTKRLEKEQRELKRIYNFDYLEQEHKANIIINTEDISVDKIVERIVKSISASSV